LSFFFLSVGDVKKNTKKVLVVLNLLLFFSSFSGILIHTSSNIEKSGIWFQITYFISYFLPAFILRFVLNLSGKESSKKFVFFMYIPGILLSLSHMLGWHDVFGGIAIQHGLNKIVYVRKSILSFVYIPYLYLYFILSFNLLLDWQKKAKVFRDKKMAKIIGWVGMVSFMITGGFTIYFTSFGYSMGMISLSLLLWFVAICYAFMKYKFSEITSADAAEAILEKVRDLILLVDQEGRIITANQRFYQILGCKKQEVVGFNFKDFIDDYEKITHRFRRKTDKKSLNDEYVFEVNYKAKDGELVPVKISLSIVFDKAKEMIGVVVVAQDVRIIKMLETEIENKKKTEKDLLESNKKLKEVDKIKTDFISIISHELRTPLTSILGFAKIVKKRLNHLRKKEEVSEKGVEGIDTSLENLSIIIQEGERLGNLINDVLDIAKMDAGKTDWKFRKLKIRDLIERAMDVTFAIMEEKGLCGIKNIQEDLPEIEGDFDRLLQVLINLISNAVKFSDMGSIKCEATLKQDFIEISISDQGIGIGEEDQENIFDKFKQVGDTLTNRPCGTGLGLPISRQIVEHHGGKIWAESVLGKGSAFFFTLPSIKKLNAPQKMNTENLSEIPQDVDLKSLEIKKKILFLDPDPHHSILVRELLEESGYAVFHLEEGRDAFKSVEEEKPELIIMDVALPDGNGFEIITSLKNNLIAKNIPIIILSEVENLAKGFLAGAERYMSKPIDGDELLKNIEYLINKNINTENVLIAIENEATLNKVLDILYQKGYKGIYVTRKEDVYAQIEKYKPKILIIEDHIILDEEIIRIKKSKGMENTRVYVLKD
jgi:PAS domain S-box-containing protein